MKTLPLSICVRHLCTCLLFGAGMQAAAQSKSTVEDAQAPLLEKAKVEVPLLAATDNANNTKTVVIQAQKTRAVLSLSSAAIQAQLPGINPLKTLHHLAGVTFQSADPWGNNEQNFSLYVHGFSAQQLGYTLDGIPLGDQQYGNYNGLSPQRALISENLRALQLNSGVADVATASTSNLGGSIEIFSNDPRNQEAWTVAQTLGSYRASRTYVRYDSGEIGDAAQQARGETQAFYLSAARLRARAWDFDAVQGGEQLNAKWVQYLPHAKLSAFLNYSDKTEPNEDSVVQGPRERFVPYTRPFTYPDFAGAVRYLDPFGQPPRADGANYRNYFGVAQRRDYLGYLKHEWQIDSNNQWTNQVYAHRDQGLGAVAGPIGVAGLPPLFRVYYPQQDLKQSFGGSGYAVRTTEYGIARYGVLSTWQQKQDEHQWQLSLWAEHNRSSAYRRWYALDVNAPLTPYQVPRDPLITQYGSEIRNRVLQFSVQDDWMVAPNWRIQAGTKSSLQFAEGWFPIQPKLGAILGGSSALPEGAITTRQWFLPQLGVLHALSAQEELYVNLQKTMRQFVTYGAVGPSPWSLSNQSAFDLFKRTAEPETALHLESGWRGTRRFTHLDRAVRGTEFFAPLSALDWQLSAYAVQFHDRLLQISPTPVISSIVNGNPILANVGSVQTRGVDVSWNLHWGPQMSWSNALSYNRSSYGEDYFNGSSRVPTAGKQVPGSPQWLNKSVLRFKHGLLEWQLSADYVGKRYATYTNDLSVAPYLLMGVAAQACFSCGAERETVLSLQITNLNNRRGTSTLVVGAANDTYNTFPIPPRQIFVTLTQRF